MQYLRHAYMIKRFAIYGILIAAAAISLQLIQYKLLIINHSIELYSGILALIFTITGIYAGQRLTRKKEVVIEKLVYATPEPVINTRTAEVDEQLREQLGISKREFEILELMSHGHSNKEIADKLFVSVSTVKTHTSNIFLKLDVRRRTAAVKKAQDLNLIA